MKQPFRYFRGEFTSGKYLYALVVCPNFSVQDVLDELVYWTLFQWKLEDETNAGEMAIRREDIINIAKIAGLFQPRSYGDDSFGSIYFTESRVTNGQERSERGLLDMGLETFKFVRTTQNEYDDDIVNEASDNMRMTLVPEGTKPVGYVPFNKRLYADDGTVMRESLLSEPPADGTPYVEYYGEKFLVHEEFFSRETPLPIEVFKLLFECVQHIRYNGPSIISFVEITRILCAKLIYDIEIKPQSGYYTVYYKTNELAEVTYRNRRFKAWQSICSQKFKLFALENKN